MGGGFTISNALKSIKPASSGFQSKGQAMSVTSWPATSSITTCEGSSLPQPRASRVAAGMPTAVATTMSRRIAGNCHTAGRCDARSHQRKPAASEPHVPGPGFRRPAPKNVATSVAHRGAVDVGAKGSIWLFAMLVGVDRFDVLGIVERRRDYVGAACPLTEINEPASVAAKGKVRVLRQHNLLAGWTSQANGTVLWHADSRGCARLGRSRGLQLFRSDRTRLGADLRDRRNR